MRGNNMICSVVVFEEDDWFVAKDISSNVASQGKSLKEALNNLKEALELFYEDNPTSINKTAIFTTLEVLV